MHHEAEPVDKKRARALLNTYWCNRDIVPPEVMKQIDVVSLPGETALDTVSRIAEIRTDDIQAFDHVTLKRRLSDIEFRDSIKEATQYKQR